MKQYNASNTYLLEERRQPWICYERTNWRSGLLCKVVLWMRSKPKGRFRQNKLTFCLLDVMLPKIDGFTQLVKSSKEKRTSNSYFICDFARSMKEDRIKGLQLVLIDYITKPFDFG